VIGEAPGDPAVTGAEARQQFSDAVRELDNALVKSASAARDALQQLASRGKDFTENDLKDALVSLRNLEQDCLAAASRIAEAMTVNLRREMKQLAAHAQNVGVEASAGFASMMDRLAGGIGATPGVAAMRDASVRMALLASGVLAGVADALGDQSRARHET
jgi:hypothetical protein